MDASAVSALREEMRKPGAPRPKLKKEREYEDAAL